MDPTDRHAVVCEPQRRRRVLPRYTARPDLVTGASQTVTVRAGDQELQSFVAHTAGRRLRRIPLSTAGQGTSEQVEIQIDMDHTFVSATLPAGERHLGIQVHHAFVHAFVVLR